MVYRGRPSTGCMKCRQRKIKCDERPGGCVKCEERAFVCPGYQNNIDRLFQDESAHVEQRAKTAKAKAIALRDQRYAQQRLYAHARKFKESIAAPLLGPLIDQGINFFMSNIALGLDQPPMQSDAYHRHLTTFGFHPIIATSMTALGLAGISNMNLNYQFRREATRWYLKALQMTNDALASPHFVRSDNTLLATMLLTMFEATSNEQTLAGWSNHVQGSAQLLKIRGPEQFSTPAGRWMYQQTVGLLTMNCMGRGEHLPDFVMELNKESEKNEDLRHPGNRYYRSLIAVTNFRADVLQGKISEFKDIIDRALEIDAVAKATFEGVDKQWMYEVVAVEQGTYGVFGTFYHIYRHLAAAQTWNWVRYHRIYIHDIIRNTILLAFSMSKPPLEGSKYTTLLQQSTLTLYNLQADILASIPQHLHDTPKAPMKYRSEVNVPENAPALELALKKKFFWSNFQENLGSSYKYSTEAIADDRLPVIRVSGGYTGLWSFYVAGATAVATPEVQKFVLNSLNRVDQELGIRQGKVLASALQLKIQSDKSAKTPAGIVPAYLPMVGAHLAEPWVNDQENVTYEEIGNETQNCQVQEETIPC